MQMYIFFEEKYERIETMNLRQLFYFRYNGFLHLNIVYLQKEVRIMAGYLKSEFKPTPMIFGAEGRRFLESTVNVKKESKKRLAEMEKNFEKQRIVSAEDFFNGK